ncbi:hypothetical protein [Nocardioides euryhalodurans]|uniref:hypothetical protein n=1 Tax=Nocardioides euryhalodurans TaxID=2518370 RepID=UPI001ABEDE1F|nr:hypothetical protein [Nocardioides euryhalodurans]
MHRAVLSVFTISALTAGLLAATGTAGAAPRAPGAGDRLDVYVGELSAGQVSEVVDLGIDRHELKLTPVAGEDGAKAQVRVEAIMSKAQANQLRREGVEMETKLVEGGQTVAQRATTLAAEGFEVWSMYGGPGGLKEQYEQLAAKNPGSPSW